MGLEEYLMKPSWFGWYQIQWMFFGIMTMLLNIVVVLATQRR